MDSSNIYNVGDQRENQGRRAIGIIRCSGKRQLEKYGPSVQERGIRESLEYFPLGPVELWKTIELQESASGWNRKKWETIMDDCIEIHKQGKAQVVIFPRVDRETRFLAGSFPKLLEVIRSGLLVYFSQERLLLDTNNPDSFEEYQREALDAQAYIRVLRRNLKNGKQQSIQETGRWGGGFLKYGLSYNSNRGSEGYTGYLEVEEEEAGVVLDIFRRVDKGQKQGEVVRWLNKESIPTKRRGLGWTQQQLSRVLHDRAYIREGYFGKTGKDDNIPMLYPQIVPVDLFNRVQARLRVNQKNNRGSTRHDRVYVIQGLGVCGECGGGLTCQTIEDRKSGLTRKYLQCLRQRGYPHVYNCYQPPRWNLDLVEDKVWDQIKDIIFSIFDKDSTFETITEDFRSGEVDRKKRMVEARGKIEGFRWEKQRVLTQVRKGHVTEEEAEVQFKAIRSEHEYWQEEINKLQSLEANARSVLDQYWDQVNRLREYFSYDFFQISAEQKKEILNLLLQEFVLFKDGRIELRLRLPVTEKQVAETIAGFSLLTTSALAVGDTEWYQ